jgi:hypothetical protein
MDEADFEGDARLLDMLGDEIRAVVDVKLFGNAADDPFGLGLRQIACRKASAVLRALGASRLRK